MPQIPYFSIITVCLNSEKTLARTIDSIRNQTFRDVEYIVIDGGSTDSTLSIINDNKDIINIFHSGKDHGIYYAMNKGLSLATGKWIGIINSDDWYEPHTFQTIFDLSKNMNEGVIHGLCRYYKGEKVDKVMGVHHNNLREMAICHPTCFVSSALYQKYGNFNTNFSIAADYDLLLRFYLKGVDFLFLEKILANFTLGGFSSSEFVRIDALNVRRNHNLVSSKTYIAFYLYNSAYRLIHFFTFNKLKTIP
jgi:glycosyltransferase involved in cell wall biosynthesis